MDVCNDLEGEENTQEARALEPSSVALLHAGKLTSPLSLSACRLSGLLLGRGLQIYGLSERTRTTLEKIDVFTQ